MSDTVVRACPENNGDAATGGFQPAGARLLFIGDEASPLGVRLLSLGCDLHHVALPHQAELLSTPSQIRGELYHVVLPDPADSLAPFDGVIFEGYTAHYHPLALFSESYDVLRDGGVVALVDGQGEINGDYPWRGYVPGIAVRCGFAEDAHPLLEVAGIPPGQAQAFRKTTQSRWRIGHAREPQWPGIRELFHKVFGYDPDPQWWVWKYGQDRGFGVVAYRDGRIIAHYGGIFRSILICGQPGGAFQICDVMVDPKERGVMTRQGPFSMLGVTWPEVYSPSGFGFPTERHMRLAEKLGLYAEVGRLDELRWPPSSARPRVRSRITEIGAVTDARGSETVNALWQEMAEDFQDAVLGVRDWEYVQRRYLNHPLRKYEVLQVTDRLGGRPLGILVLRRLEKSCELVDLIASRKNFPVLVDQARRMAARWKLDDLYAWATNNGVSSFPMENCTVTPLDIYIPASCWMGAGLVERFRQKWWLMAGDTDFR